MPTTPLSHFDIIFYFFIFHIFWYSQPPEKAIALPIERPHHFTDAIYIAPNNPFLYNNLPNHRSCKQQSARAICFPANGRRRKRQKTEVVMPSWVPDQRRDHQDAGHRKMAGICAAEIGSGFRGRPFSMPRKIWCWGYFWPSVLWVVPVQQGFFFVFFFNLLLKYVWDFWFF